MYIHPLICPTMALLRPCLYRAPRVCVDPLALREEVGRMDRRSSSMGSRDDISDSEIDVLALQ